VWATQWPPVSLATTAAFLERDGHQLKVMDCPAVGLDPPRLTALTEAFQPDFVFWTTGTPTLNHDLRLAERFKHAYPSVITGVFGTHVTALPEVALKHPGVDVVIRREPEQTIQNICRHRRDDWGTLDGLSFREGDFGHIHHTPDRNLLDADAIPAPAWYHMDLSPYRLPLKGTPFLIVAPIRGCPYRCSFCTAPLYYGRRLRKRPVEWVADEMAEGIRRYGVRDFFVWADTFTADRVYVKSFCREIMARNLKISWTCNSRVDTVDRDTLLLMKRSGLWMISFGLESGDNHVLGLTQKGITVEQSRKAVFMAHHVGIKTSGHFVLGLPGETEETLQKTLALALDLPLDIAQFYAATPFPGTGLYDLAMKKGWIRADSPLAQDRAGMDLPGLRSEQVDAFRRYAYKRFYGRPRAAKNILSMMEPRAAGRLIRNLGAFIGWAGKSN